MTTRTAPLLPVVAGILLSIGCDTSPPLQPSASAQDARQNQAMAEEFAIERMRSIVESVIDENDRETITARDIRLVDSDGRERISLAVSDDGKASISLYRDNGTKMIEITDSEKAPGVYMYDHREDACLVLTQSKTGAHIYLTRGQFQKLSLHGSEPAYISIEAPNGESRVIHAENILKLNQL